MPPIKPGIYQKEITFSSVIEIIFLFTQLYFKDNKMSLRFLLQNNLYELKKKKNIQTCKCDWEKTANHKY